MAGPQVICVGADAEWRESVAADLRTALDGVEVVATADPAAALSALDAVRTRALVSAGSFPAADRSALDLAEAARDRAPDVTPVVYGDLGDVEPPGFVETVAVDDPAGGSDVAGTDEPGAGERLVSLVEAAVAGRARAYPEPDGEDRRLDALGALPTDDGRLRAAFDRLSDLAAAAFDVEYAFVSAMWAADQEQLACHGFEPRTVARERSVCAYTVAADDVVVVEALEEDPLFADQDVVTELGAKWYAGAPVRSGERVVGTFCVLGTDEFPGIDRERLRAFAAEAGDQFEFATLRQA